MVEPFHGDRRAPKGWPEEALMGGAAPVPHDLLSDPGANPGHCSQEGGTQCFSDNVEQGLWDWGRWDWGRWGTRQVCMGGSVPAGLGDPIPCLFCP